MQTGVSVTCEEFGVDAEFKRAVKIYRFRNTRVDGLEVDVSTWGATIVSVRCPDQDGTMAEVSLNHRTLAGIQNQSAYYGAT
eukprot:SAG11_NODE_18982_length_476_cov_1.944297_2_plen_81_part_01